jgi:hypothetical protein
MLDSLGQDHGPAVIVASQPKGVSEVPYRPYTGKTTGGFG